MEFEIDVQHGLNGHVEITDYSKEYGQYYPEDAEGMNSPDKFKYSQSNSINVLIRTNTDKVTLLDVLLDQHDQDKETTIFDVDRDGYFMVTHFVLPTTSWIDKFRKQFTRKLRYCILCKRFQNIQKTSRKSSYRN